MLLVLSCIHGTIKIIITRFICEGNAAIYVLLFALIQDENFEKKVSNFTAVIAQTYKLDMKNRSVGLTHESLRLMSEAKEVTDM